MSGKIVRTFHFPKTPEKLCHELLPTETVPSSEKSSEVFTPFCNDQKVNYMTNARARKSLYGMKSHLRNGTASTSNYVSLNPEFSAVSNTSNENSKNALDSLYDSEFQSNASNNSTDFQGKLHELFKVDFDSQWRLPSDEEKPRVVVEPTPSIASYYSEISGLRDSDEENGCLALPDYEPKHCSYSGPIHDKPEKKPAGPKNINRLEPKLNRAPAKRRRKSLNMINDKTFKSLGEIRQRYSRNKLNFTILRGSGDCFKDISHIAQKVKTDDIDPTTLLALHRVLFDVHGSCNNDSKRKQTKENILKFSGYRFSKQSAHFHQRISILKNLDNQVLDQISFILLEISYTKKLEAIGKILEFLMDPRKKLELEIQKLKDNEKEEEVDTNPIDSIKMSLMEGKGPNLRVVLKRLEKDVVDSFDAKGEKVSEELPSGNSSSASWSITDDMIMSDLSASDIEEQNIKYGECLVQPSNVLNKQNGTSPDCISNQKNPKPCEDPDVLEKPLKDIEEIRFRIECATPEDLWELHDVLFAVRCDTWDSHRKVLDFEGFSFSANSMEYNLRKSMMGYMNMECLKKIAKLLCVLDTQETLQKKDELILAILNFLVCPKRSDIKVNPTEDGNWSGPNKLLCSAERDNRECDLPGANKLLCSAERDNRECDLPGANKLLCSAESNSRECDVNMSESQETSAEVYRTDFCFWRYGQGDNGSITRSSNAGFDDVSPDRQKNSAHEFMEPPFFREDYNSEISKFRQTFTSSSDDDESISALPMAALCGHPSDGQLRADIQEIIIQNLLTMTIKDLVKVIYSKYPDFDLKYRSKFIKSRARKILSTLHKEPVKSICHTLPLASSTSMPS